MNAPPTTLVTLAEYVTRPDPEDGTYDELIDGVVVYRPLPTMLHGFVCGNACGVFGEHKRRVGGSASVRCGLVVTREPDSVFGPDVSYWRVRPNATLDHGWATVPPDAAFETIDVDESYTEAMKRVRRLVRFGIRLFWLVDPVAQQVVELRDGMVHWLDRADTLDGGDVLPGFAVKVAELFE